MFTGLVEEVGTVAALEPQGDALRLTIEAPKVLSDAAFGDSIAVNGVCLTVTDFDERRFTADVMQESLDRTGLGQLVVGSPVNLERAMALGDRLGGHLVLGHVDAVGEVAAVQTRGIAWELRVKLPAELRGYVAPKGSVAVDGISLTVTDVSEADFGLGIIPHTLASTTLKGAAPGRRVNLEADVLARYVRQALSGLLAAGEDAGRKAGGEGGLTRESLRRLGF